MTRRKTYLLSIIVIVIIAGGYRVYAANRLNVDIDERTYLNAGLEYARYMRAGQFDKIINTRTTYEHPAFYKIMYGGVLLTQEPLNTLADEDLVVYTPVSRNVAAKLALASRYLSVFWGIVAVTVLALINPLAGFFLGVQTLSVKFTSEIYLEALPLLTSLLCALTYLRWYTNFGNTSTKSQRNIIWLFFSAAFMGLSAASKYDYAIVGIGICIHLVVAILRKQTPWLAVSWLAGWGIVSIICFYIFNPYIWPNPLGRVVGTIDYHLHLQNYVYDKSLTSKQPGYPFWQPLLWLFSPANYYDMNPDAVFKINIDILICILAVIGLPRFFQKRQLFFYWFVAGLIFLIVWGAKWPQYSLIIMAPFCLGASEGVLTLWSLARKFLQPKKDPQQNLEVL